MLEERKKLNIFYHFLGLPNVSGNEQPSEYGTNDLLREDDAGKK